MSTHPDEEKDHESNRNTRAKRHKYKSTHPDKEIDHESNVECEVDLLRRVLIIRDAVLDLDMMILRITN